MSGRQWRAAVFCVTDQVAAKQGVTCACDRHSPWENGVHSASYLAESQYQRSDPHDSCDCGLRQAVADGGARCGHGLGHIVAIQADYRQVVARLQFFIGRHYHPGTWTVSLGRNTSRVHYDIDSAYFFSYFDNIGEDSADGEVPALTRLRLITRPRRLAHPRLVGDGTVTCWGANRDGQLGLGWLVTLATPVRLQGLP